MAVTSHDIQFVGFHKFRRDDGGEYGSFEVFYENGDDPLVKVGWYWWLAHKGCIAESEATGPFPTAEGAMLDALESSDPYQGMKFPTPSTWKKAAEILNFSATYHNPDGSINADAIKNSNSLEANLLAKKLMGDDNV